MDPQVIERPSVAELTFQLFDWPVHPELIGGIASRTFERDGYRLTLHLTAAGHVLEWRWQASTLVEVLANQSDPLPENRLLFAHRIGGERSENHRPVASVSYQTCFQVERLPQDLFVRLQDELRSDGEENGVLLQLQTSDRLGLGPLSFVDLQAREGSLIAHSYHTYPEECSIVKVQSLIEFEE